MKKIFTLGLSLFTMVAAFADFSPSRLVVTVKGNDDIKVVVDENRFGQQVKTGDAVFERLTPGYHTVSVYSMEEHRGWFGRHDNDMQLLYSSQVVLKPMSELIIKINRHGRAVVKERRIGDYGYGDRDDGDRRYDRRRDEDRRWDNDRRYDNGYGYGRPMTNEEFYAAKRMVQRENFDENRMVVAKHIADVNYFTAAQVKEIAILFSFDSAKLDFAKYAYRNTVDRSNYFIMNDLFSSSSCRNELNDYTRNFR